MGNVLNELEVQLTYLMSEYKNIIMKREKLNRLKNRYNDSINDINNELEDVYKAELEVRAKISLLKIEMKNIKEEVKEVTILKSIKNFSKKKQKKIKEKVMKQAIEDAIKILGCYHDYYSENGQIVVDKMIIKMGYNPEEIKEC